MDSESTETVELAYDVYVKSDTKEDKCPIIFLHGLFWNKYMLRELAETMCATTKRKVYCLDLRCHDQSPFRDHITFDIMAEDIIRFIKDRNLEKVSFVCHSFSSTHAYLILLKEPAIVEKIVMVDHPPFLEYTMDTYKTYIYPQFQPQNKLLDILDPSITLSAAKRKIRNLSEGAETAGKRVLLQKAAYELIKVNNEFKWKTDHTFLLGFGKTVCTTPRIKKMEERSDHEILIIRCKNSDIVTDEIFQAVLKDNPNAILKTIDDATHLLMFEKKEEFLEAVKEFLS